MSELPPRYNTSLSMAELYPSIPGKCACGCGTKLEGRRRRWASDKCNDAPLRRYLILKGHGQTIRRALYARDKGVCAKCKRAPLERDDPRWEAHHKVAVCEGGGGCDLDGYDTLCLPCHKEENRLLRLRRKGTNPDEQLKFSMDKPISTM